jgi:hypothetical protein
MRRRLTIFLTFLGGLYFFLEFLIPATIPGGVTKLPQYGKVLSEAGGTYDEATGAFVFAQPQQAEQALKRLGLAKVVTLPAAYADREIRLRPFKKGRMSAVNGLVMSVPVADADGRDGVAGWSYEQPCWEREYPSPIGPRRFETVAARCGGRQVSWLADIDRTFEFEQFSAAVKACETMGIAVVPPVGTLDRAAWCELGRRGSVLVRIVQEAGDRQEDFFNYRSRSAQWTNATETTRYFVFNAYQDEITVAFICVGALAIGLGLINVLMSHGVTVLFRRRRWGYSATLVASMITTMVVIAWDWHGSVAKEAARKYERQTVAAKHAAAVTQWEREGRQGDMPAVADFALDEAEKATQKTMLPGKVAGDASLVYSKVLVGIGGLFVSLGSAMFSLLAVYIAAAAYRAFRLKSGEAALMMIFAVMVMIGQTPLAAGLVDPILRLVGITEGVTAIRAWVLVYVNTPAFRAIELGSAIAGLAMGFRVWLSMERGSFYSD